MDTKAVYSARDWDETSESPHLHMSYLMHLLLPRRHFGCEQLQIQKQMILEGFSKIKTNLSDDLQIVPVGSKAEGYAIPDAVRLTEKPYIEYLSDIDAMFVKEGFHASAKELNKDGTNNVFIETKTTHPGYGRVRCTSPRDIQTTFWYHDEDTNEYYLSSSAIMHQQLEMLGFEESSDALKHFPHGPAVSSLDTNPFSLERSKSHKMYHPQDYVLAIQCDGWPERAESWIVRKRKNFWLTPDIIDSVISGGFHVVPVAHRSSENAEIEWRLSFAKAEQLLAEHAVTASQRQCYVYLKVMCLETIKKSTKFSSYCLKNVFLYCCDELPVSSWDKDPFGCVLYMLDVVLEFVQRGNLPSYFIPENNLIDHLNAEELETITIVLHNLRSDPLSAILEFTDSRIFCFPQGECLSYSTVFRTIVQLVVDEIAAIEQIDIGRAVLGCFTDVQCNIASVMLGEKRSSFKYHLDFYQIYVQEYVKMPLVDFIIYMGIRLESPFISLMFYEKCLSEVQTFPEFEYLRGNMACMCFALALSHDDQSKEKKMRLYQAERIYKEVLQNNGVHFPTTIDFANYLVYNERWVELATLLQQFIEMEKKKPSNMQNGYYPAESTTLNDQLRREVKHIGCFLASSLSFAYYFLLKALIKLKSPNVNNILKCFEKHCESVRSYGDYELLGYSATDMEHYDIAEEAFTKAIQLNQNNLLAQVNLNLCRVHKRPVQKYPVRKATLRYLLMFAYVLDNNFYQMVNLLFNNKYNTE